MEYRGAPIYEGMTVTDEPGIYMEGKFGVRIENTLAVVPYMSTEFGEFLQFETLTLCPIDLSPVIPELLTAEEKSWLDSYHKRVYDSLSPYLAEEEKTWPMSVSHPICGRLYRFISVGYRLLDTTFQLLPQFRIVLEQCHCSVTSLSKPRPAL